MNVGSYIFNSVVHCLYICIGEMSAHTVCSIYVQLGIQAVRVSSCFDQGHLSSALEVNWHLSSYRSTFHT